MRQLPAELWMQIAELVVDEDAVAFPAYHVITRTLLALSTLNQAASETARRLLLEHCLYIDRAWRLDSLNRCLEASPRTRAGNIQKLSLSPFPSHTMNKPSVVEGIHTLLTKIGSGLRKVVVDIPFRYCRPYDDVEAEGLYQILRNAFARLENVEEVVSVNDELFLDEMFEGDIQNLPWFQWSKLRFLALYNLDIGRPAILEAITTKLPLLKVLVLARADSLEYGIQELYRGLRAPLDVHLVNTPFGHDMALAPGREAFQRCLEPSQETLEARGQSCRMVSFRRVDVDADVPAASTWDYDPISSCQNFLLAEGIRRTLWQL